MEFIKKYKTILILILLGIFGYFVYTNFAGDSGQVVEVLRTQPESIRVVRTVTSNGEVTADKIAKVAFPLPGNITLLYVDEGEKVEQGELLAQIYNYDKQQSSESLKNARDAALREKDLFVENFETKQEAYGGQDEYDIQLRKLNELVAQAEASYQASLGTYYNTFVNSPISGTILESNKDVGEFTVAGETVFRIADLDNLIFEIDLDQEDFGQVRPGMDVEITLDAYDDEIFEGTIDSIPVYAEEDASGVQRFTIEINFENKEDTPALLGMDGDASILINSTDGQVQALTFDAVFSENGEDFVWIVEDEILKKYPIEVGLEGDIYTQINSPLDGLNIVVPESDNPEEGARVSYLD